jgi:hypothetical protein
MSNGSVSESASTAKSAAPCPRTGSRDDGRLRHLARWVFATFVITFTLTRILVLAIMIRRVPDLYAHVGGTHLHHLNYGIFLLSGVGAYLLFGQPEGRKLTITAILYGIGLALTFDEFGMWLHLGGSYWQRASFDAVSIIAGLLGLLVVAPLLKNFRPHHWATVGALILLLTLFTVLLGDSLHRAEDILAPKLHHIESFGPP